MLHKLSVKVCGMRYAENIKSVENLGYVDIMGFIFYNKSPRHVNQDIEYLPRNCKRAGVFVNDNLDNILKLSDKLELSHVQLHGSESPEFCDKLSQYGINIIKAFSIGSIKDLDYSTRYEGTCDLYLFDSKTCLPGGSGKTFNWSLLNRYNGKTRFFLSGGIGVDSVEQLKKFNHSRLAGIDLNSRFETAPALKDTGKLTTFFQSFLK